MVLVDQRKRRGFARFGRNDAGLPSRARSARRKAQVRGGPGQGPREPVDEMLFEIAETHGVRSILAGWAPVSSQRMPRAARLSHNHRMRRVLFGAIVPAALVAAVGTFGFWRVETPRPAPVAVVEPCEWQQIQVECGTVRVPENHADPDGPTIELFL